jgi:hypothetical protein
VIAHAPSPRLRSFLLRVTLGRGPRRFLVQDLRTGERREFASERELHRFLAGRWLSRLR